MEDLLDSVRRELRARLDELRPLVSEYERLKAAEQALGAGGESSALRSARNSGRRSRPSRSSAARRASTRGERQANRESVLAVLRDRPGVTRAELKQTTRLSGAGVAQHLRRLTEAGIVAEESLPSGGVGYRVRLDDAGDGAGPMRSAGEPGGAQAATSG